MFPIVLGSFVRQSVLKIKNFDEGCLHKCIQTYVGFGQLHEKLFIAGGLVRVVFQGHLTVLFLNFFGRGVVGDAQNFIGIKVGHLVVKLRNVVNDDGHQDPANHNEDQTNLTTGFYPWVLLVQASLFFLTSFIVSGVLGIH